MPAARAGKFAKCGEFFRFHKAHIDIFLARNYRAFVALVVLVSVLVFGLFRHTAAAVTIALLANDPDSRFVSRVVVVCFV